MNDVLWIVLILYLVIWVVGGYFIWKAYRLSIKNDLRYATGPWQGKLKSPEKHIKRLALIELFSGISLLVFAIVIQIFKIELRLWGPVLTVIGMTRVLQQLKIAKQDKI